ncbi:MAG: hypothetical protein ABFD07_07700 [Methanobacterium sp.]|jgi:hypothetical protein
MEYEMRIPQGTPGQLLAEVMEKYDKLELKQTDYGPVLYGEKQDLEGAQDIIIKGLNQRIKELENKE